MSLLIVILLIAAVVCFVLAVTRFVAAKLELIALGLAFWAATALIQAIT